MSKISRYLRVESPCTLIGVIIYLAAILPLIFSFIARDGITPFFGLKTGIWTGLGVLAGSRLLKGENPEAATMSMILTAVLLLLKPIIAPVMHMYNAKFFAFPYDSETHLYFVLPGIGLLVFAGYDFIKKRVHLNS